MGAKICAFVSLYEGFGLPILEAMTSGAVVLTSNRGATAETAGDAAALVDPESLEDMAGGLVRLMTDPEARQALVDRARDHVRSFSWEKSAAVARRALQKAAGAR